jgi:hypothetical protein
MLKKLTSASIHLRSLMIMTSTRSKKMRRLKALERMASQRPLNLLRVLLEGEARNLLISPMLMFRGRLGLSIWRTSGTWPTLKSMTITIITLKSSLEI